MPRRTKIVATLGPSTENPQVLEGIIRAGVSVVRLNFSHGDAQGHLRTAQTVRETATRLGQDVAILADLQGPKIRVERFADGPVELREGDSFFLDPSLARDAGTREGVGVAYGALPQDVRSGDTLLLDDGQLVLRVESVEGTRIHCKVELGGQLSNNKGINRQGGGLSAPALTDKDRADIVSAAQLEADYVAVSFPRAASDLNQARELLEQAGSQAGVIAKIERAEAVEAIESIIDAADAVMVARGDLGVEIGDAELPGVQKRIIALARDRNRVVITATQMMESMITQPTPTRAEVMDVANAVMDGTDAVMLSAETAAGAYPVRTVESMDRICLGAERQRETQRSSHRIDSHFGRIDEAIAMAAMYTANHLDVSAIIALTESGATALWMSRISSAIPIYALTQHETTRRRTALYRGVYPIAFDIMHHDAAVIVLDAVETLKQRGMVSADDLVVVTKGDFSGISGGTNALKILRA